MPEDNNKAQKYTEILGKAAPKDAPQKMYGGVIPQSAVPENKWKWAFISFLLGLIVLINFCYFPFMQTWTAPLVIGTLEVGIILISARLLNLNIVLLAKDIRTFRRAFFAERKQ